MIIENVGEGHDVVFANTDFRLRKGSEIEELRANRISGQKLTGNEFDNIIVGSNGKDTLEGGAAATVDGRLTMTSMLFVTRLRRWSKNGGGDRVNAFVSYSLTANVEDLFLHGSAANGFGNLLDNRIYGDTSPTLSRAVTATMKSTAAPETI